MKVIGFVFLVFLKFKCTLCIFWEEYDSVENKTILGKNRRISLEQLRNLQYYMIMRKTLSIL